MRDIVPIAALLFCAGCATTTTTERAPVPVATEPMDVAIAVGHIVDSRPNDHKQKQIQISSAKVKNTIADILTQSRRLRTVANLPTEVTGTTMSGMLEAARSANCDYLVLGEIDQFDVIDLGANPRTFFSVILEGITFPIGVIVFLLSERKSGIWINGAIYDRTAMAVLSVSLHFVATENGRVAGHISNAVSEATRPANALVYGDITNPEDDWVDIGKELGLVALHNLAVGLIERIAAEIQRIRTDH